MSLSAVAVQSAIGLGSLLSTYQVPAPLIYRDLPVETVTAALLLTYLLRKDDVGDRLSAVAARLGLPGVAARFDAVEERHLGRGRAACGAVFRLSVRPPHVLR